VRRPRIDWYLVAILAMVGLATVLPARGAGAAWAGRATTLAIGLLFFLYGARLSARAAWDGLRHWRLHGVVLLSTFALFPLLGLATRALVPTLLSPTLFTGVVYLTVLPSTVQSSIAFTSIARGNVAAAICAASFSNLLGVVLTPLLVGLLLSRPGWGGGVMDGHGAGFSAHAVVQIALQLLLPFLAGQALRPLIGGWVQAHKRLLNPVDRGSILLVVYTAFSEGVVAGIWHQVTPVNLAVLLAVAGALLAVVLVVTSQVSRRLGFSRPDQITIVFCGSKKSLATGLPMATVLFGGSSVGLVVLPVMLFHQIQLLVCAVLAPRYAAEPDGQPRPAGASLATASGAG
jgi:sodium/bile acid cotransporter 7